MTKNRFSSSRPIVDLDNPAALTSVPHIVEEAVEPPVPEPTKKNILAGKLEKKPAAKSYGFYLSDDVVAELEKLAKRNKISKSKVLETILRDVLFDE